MNHQLPFQSLDQLKAHLLAYEAQRWLGFTDSGKNEGQMIVAFQKAVDGRAHGEAWCMSFVQYCIANVDKMVDWMLLQSLDHKSRMAKTEHCLTAWMQSPEECRVQDIPKMGDVMIWQKGSTSAGHCGIVLGVDLEDRKCTTIEGNTGPGQHVERLGDGVWIKQRSFDPVGDMRVRGWLRPWK